MEDLTEKAEKAASRNKCESSNKATTLCRKKLYKHSCVRVKEGSSFWHLRKTKIEAEIFGGDDTSIDLPTLQVP